MIALIQLKGLAKEGFSKCPQRTFLKARRPVNNQAMGQSRPHYPRDAGCVNSVALCCHHISLLSLLTALSCVKTPQSLSFPSSPRHHVSRRAYTLEPTIQTPFFFFSVSSFFQHHICRLHLTSIL